MFTLHPIDSNDKNEKNVLERGQALVEYALIAVLVGIAFGLALAASAPVTGNLFNAVVNDLLRQTVVGDVPNPEGFWETVTKVYEFVPTGGALSTNTPAAPTEVPTDGPSPTPSNTYTPTEPIPTRTPSMTPTAIDNLKNAPFLDTVDEANWWRIDNNVFLSGIPWRARFWNNNNETVPNFDGPPDRRVNGIWDLDYTDVFIADFPTDNFSAKFERKIELETEQTLSFRVLSDDGVRMFVQTGETVTPITLTNPLNGNTNSYTGQPATLYTGGVTLPAGTHYILVDYYEGGGNARLKVDILGGGANPDDEAIDSSGGSSSNVFSCAWGIVNNERNSNTERQMFDDYTEGQNAAGTKCYLEWRGAVLMPEDRSQMQMSFWDVWEFDDVTVDGWLEIAEYIPEIDEKGNTRANRDAMVWQPIDLDRMGTANFNWTRTVIDIAPLMSSFTSNRLAFRFVMQIPAGTVADRQWFIDDIEFKNKTDQVFPVNKMWTLNDVNEANDFIRTGGTSNPGEKSGWGLVSNNKLGPSGFSFHDSADTTHDNPVQIAGLGAGGSNYTQYKNFTLAPSSDLQNNVRIHALELNGWVDLTQTPNPDAQGNTGIPVLSFYHAYDLGTRTGLAVQYSTTPYSNVGPATWTNFPDGLIRPVTATGATRALTLQELVIGLQGLPGNPSRIRIRFAMLVHVNAELRDGWWIDQIRLGRAENNKWLNYPFNDDVQGQGPLFNWRYTGSWGSTGVRGHQAVIQDPGYVPFSYASSPNESYTNGLTSYMTMRWPIDLYNDTPSKLVQLEAGGATGPSNSFGAPAVDPNLTFYVWRELAATEEFMVQWKVASAADSTYRTLWMHRYNGSSRFNYNYGWEPVRVSLQPIMSSLVGAPGVGTGAQLTDDDIILRFVLKADASSNAAGVFIDDIDLQENTLTSHTFKLWPNNQSRNLYGSPLDPDPNLGLGTGTYFISDPDGTIDGRRYELDWKLGGTWAAQNFEKRGTSGVFAFHDSVLGGQSQAPTGTRLSPATSSDFGDAAWATENRSFSILELDRVFDLRGVYSTTDAPVLNFWTRYHIGRGDFIRVQVSHKLTGTDTAINSAMQARCNNITGLYQCYDQERGWSEWNTNYPSTTTAIWSAGSGSGATLSYGWRRISVNLAQYAYADNSSVEGKQIRIRFVMDALDTAYTNYDGWYIDGVEVTYRPQANAIDLTSGVFNDSASSMANWIGEGNWGLDPNIFIGSSGSPVSLGLWTGRWYACHSGNNPDCGALGGGSFPAGANIMLNTVPRPAPERTVVYSNINLNFGNGSPVAGWSRTDKIVGEFVLDLMVDGVNFFSGPRGFITSSDDGVRMKIEELVGGVPVANTPSEWNIINNWTDHSTTVDQATYVFQQGKRYRLTLQYFENSGGGVIQLSVSEGRYSFSDSPKYGGGLVPDVPAIPYANTSLLGRQILDLTGFGSTNYPAMELQSKYRFENGSIANVEVSRDGGFTWEQTGLNTNVGSTITSNPTWTNATSSGIDNADTGTWEVRQFNLSSFEGRRILLRFRLDRQSSYCYRRGNCENSSAVSNPSLALKDAYYNGWWIGNIRVISFPGS